MKRITILILVVCFVGYIPVLAGLDSKKAAYLGGTTKDKDFPGVKDAITGSLNTSDEKYLKFEYRRDKTSRVFTVPFEQITNIEYGQKAGRRIGAAIATGVLINPAGFALLLSKKRKHFVTIGYTDMDGKAQSAVFELGKNTVRTTLSILEARSSKKIEYQDEEARKASKGN